MTQISSSTHRWDRARSLPRRAAVECRMVEHQAHAMRETRPPTARCSACGDAADDAEADRERSEHADEGQIRGSDHCCAAERCDRDESCEEAGALDVEPLNGRVPE